MITYNNNIKDKYKRIKVIVCLLLFATSSDLQYTIADPLLTTALLLLFLLIK